MATDKVRERRFNVMRCKIQHSPMRLFGEGYVEIDGQAIPFSKRSIHVGAQNIFILETPISANGIRANARVILNVENYNLR